MSDKPLKLHLGCQNKYLKGYVNIDLPPSEHTAEKVKADIYADIRTLEYPKSTVDEVRSHHVVEHFPRQEAIALFSRWHTWLKPWGTLIVETPDFEASARKFLKAPFSDQLVLGRYIFGSHEAKWAYHRDFWYEEKFRFTLGKLGFGNFRFEKFSNNIEKKIHLLRDSHLLRNDNLLRPLGRFGVNILPNIVCYAEKTNLKIDYKKAAREILSKFLVGRESKILNVWMDEITHKLP